MKHLWPFLLLLAGCNSASQLTAVITGGVTGAATGSPAIGFAVAVATEAGASYTFSYIARVRQNAEQDAIAQIAGTLPLGTEATWQIRHTIPIGNEHGKLHVVRAIDSPLASCREIVFSVATAQTSHWYDSTICHQAEQWKWASAEPATARWGFLQ